MGWFSSREKSVVDEHAKWDYINLDDFRSTSCWNPFSYLWVWIYAIIGVAVFALDCFTAVNLLILDRWSSEIKPAISFNISKWIFVGTIMFSFALYFYEWVRAIRVMRRRGVAESYMDSLAVQWQCMRGKGYRRLLVFAALTKSKKGTDYIAFFVYFQFTSAVRIIFAEGARQFVNAVTIVSVARADLVDSHKQGTSAVGQFFVNIYTLWNNHREEALVLASMTFTLVIWLISAICLIVAVILYVVFLWHYIPQSDGRLSIYCRRKIDTRLEKIVEKKVQAALEDSQRKEQKAALRLAKKHGKGSVSSIPSVARQPTLPLLGADPEKNAGPGLLRTNTGSTTATLPPYTSRANTATEPFGLQRQPTLPTLERQPTLPSVGSSGPYGGRPPLRQDTGMTNFSNNSSHSFGPNAPLLQNGGGMGYDDGPSPPFGGPPRLGRQGSDGSLNSMNSLRGPPRATNSPLSRGPDGAYPLQRVQPRSNLASRPDLDRNPMSMAGSALNGPAGFNGPPRSGTPGGYGAPPRSNTPGTYGGPPRTNTPAEYDRPARSNTPGSYGAPAPSPMGTSPPRAGTPLRDPSEPIQRKVSLQSFNRPFAQQDRPSFRPAEPASAGSYAAYKPYAPPRAESVPNPAPAPAADPYGRSPSVPAPQQQGRNFTAPGPAQMRPNRLQRNVTAPVRRDEEEGYYGDVF